MRSHPRFLFGSLMFALLLTHFADTNLLPLETVPSRGTPSRLDIEEHQDHCCHMFFNTTQRRCLKQGESIELEFLQHNSQGRQQGIPPNREETAALPADRKPVSTGPQKRPNADGYTLPLLVHGLAILGFALWLGFDLLRLSSGWVWLVYRCGGRWVAIKLELPQGRHTLSQTPPAS